MISEHWSKAFLKKPIISVLPLKNGKQHQIDLVTLADQSKWVCKMLCRQTWLGCTADLDLSITEDFATNVAAELGITFAAYRGEDNEPILGGKAMIIPYCEGKILSLPSLPQAFLLGNLLAKLHLLPFTIEGAKPFPLISLPKKINLPDWLTTLIANCNLHCQNEAEHFILSHRDIHMANVVWRTEENPHLIDWESAGLIHPALELIGLALNCAGVSQGLFDNACFSAVLSGYRQRRGQLPAIGSHFEWLNLQSWLLWYVYCLNQGWREDAAQTLQSILLIRARVHEIEALYNHHETN